MSSTRMVNTNFEPTDRQERALTLFKEEHRLNPLRLREVTGWKKQRVNDTLRSLVDAGWIRRVNRGLYEFVDDPREAPNDQLEPADPEE